MSKFPESIIIIILAGISLLSHGIQSADPTYNYHFCGKNTTFTPKSTYKTNLNKLLKNLSANATANENGFFNFSVTTSSTPVYGLYLYRGDVSEGTCSSCVSYATNDAVTDRCPTSKQIIIWYDECSLRYSDGNIFGSDTEDPQAGFQSKMNISRPNKLAKFISTTMSGDMASQAASSTSGKKFVTNEVKLSTFETLYSMVQCTPDLPAADCIRCIQTGISNLYPGVNGGRALLPSCIVRYETYAFYNVTASPSLAPALSPPEILTPPNSNSTSNGKSTNATAKVIIGITVPMAVLALLLAVGVCILLAKRKKKRTDATAMDNANQSGKNMKGIYHYVIYLVCCFVGGFAGSVDFTAAESLQYEFSELQSATNNFSDANKLGEGGFGGVYKGKLSNGQQVAVKRLSQRSGQGVLEFKNEVVLVAKLQHRNLVRLLGFCLAGNEKLLVYEYVPNKSLDYFLFDPEKQVQLDWSTRYKIIGGIARGMLYLHEDSRLRIIHRDLKPSNILLDADMIPKISDFGMARIFGIEQSQGNTNRVVGTYGYMSPEYAYRGMFSVKCI